LPEYDDAAFTDYFRSSYIIHTVPQEMSENGADPAHFLYVHGTETVAEMESYEIDGPRSTMLSKQSYVTPRGTTWGRIDVYNHGPGFSAVWFAGIVDALNVATTTPIDDETTQVRFNFIVRKFDDAKLTSTVADAFVKEINKQVQEDQPIWEHKAFLPTPALADTDGPIMKFRKWYSQFYAEPYEVTAG
jgi:phenylpropionate dioxygenase-like ring-hydroxylating dioxygenase large terminal subunit